MSSTASSFTQWAPQQFPTASSSPQTQTHLPSARIPQQQARAYRGEQRDRATFDSSIARHDYNMAPQRLATNVPCQRGCIAPMTACDRLPQIGARDELFAPAYPLAQSSASSHNNNVSPSVAAALQAQRAPLAPSPSQYRAEQLNARLPVSDLREGRTLESAEARASSDEKSAPSLMAPTRACARREGVFSLSAAQAEKSKYLDSYKSGNEEAYAHVEALQRSMRGYDDTSQESLQRVKQWNAREAAHRQFLGYNA